MASPRPVPCPGGLVVKNGSKMRDRISSGTPGPSSSNSTSTSPRCRRERTVSRPRPSIASSAFEARAIKTWRSWPSLTARGGSAGSSSGANRPSAKRDWGGLGRGPAPRGAPGGGGAPPGGPGGGRRQRKVFRPARGGAPPPERVAPPRRERGGADRLDCARRAGAEERGERRARTRLAAEHPHALAVGADDAELGVEDEDAEGERLQHHLHEALLRIELSRPLGDHALELGVQARLLQRDRGLVGEGQEQLLVRVRERVDVPPEDAR